MCEPLVAGEDRISCLDCCANALSHEIDGDGDRLRPGGDHCGRTVNFRVTRDEVMLRDQIACKLGETIAVTVTVKGP